MPPASSRAGEICKGLSMNNVYTLARAPDGQMQGAATGAMRRHRRGAKQMPARRRAPSGCGPQARWLCCSLLTCTPACSSLAPRQRVWGSAAKCRRYSLTGPNELQARDARSDAHRKRLSRPKQPDESNRPVKRIGTFPVSPRACRECL